jgi:radical SAM protein with 4Fe4S-binding SPASM domain
MGILHRFYAAHASRVWRTETQLLSKLGLVRPPEAVQWLATSACDLACPHCYSKAGKRDPNELTVDEAKERIVDELVHLGRPMFVVAGGEALLRPDLPDVLAHVGARRVPWSMHTHGGFVLKHRALFEKHPPRMVAVSLDGPREFHDAFRGRAGSFDRALEAIRTLVDIGVREVVAGTTVTRANADLLEDLLPTVIASGAHAWGMHLFVPEGRGVEHRALVPSRDQLRRVAAFVRRRRAVFDVELDNEWGGAGDDDVYYRAQPFHCGAGRFSMVVGPTGEVMPCTTTDVRESQGNVRTTPLSTIWAKGFARFRSHQHEDGAVHDCWLQTRNGNSCRDAAFGEAAQAPSVQAAQAAHAAHAVQP